MSVHITCFREMKPVQQIGGSPHTTPVAQVGSIMTATVLEFAIGAAAVALPEGTQLIAVDHLDGTPFRYAVGASDVAVPAAGSAHRYLGSRLTLGVHPLTPAQSMTPIAVRANEVYIRTAAAS